ncbi:MAG: DUF4321 domain-containing protein [Cellulosilyticaceae bacterium]
MKNKNFWVLLLCMLAGLTVGSFVGELCHNVPVLSFLNFGESFGLDTPVAIDLGVIKMSIQFTIHITLTGIMGMMLGIFVYKKI